MGVGVFHACYGPIRVHPLLPRLSAAHADTGLYVGHVPGWPGARSQGTTVDEARARSRSSSPAKSSNRLAEPRC